MSRFHTTIAMVLGVSLGACTETSTTTATKTQTAHYDAPLGSHVPRSYDAGTNQQTIDPATAGAHPFSNGMAAPAGGGGGPR